MGINTLTYDKITDGETPEGLGFAIPVELATKIMDKLIRDGRVIRGYFGIQGKEIIPVRTSTTGIDRLQGIIVTEITLTARPPMRGSVLMTSSLTSITNRRCRYWRRWIRWRRSALGRDRW